MVNLYLDNGYADMHSIIYDTTTPYVFVIGGRGTGKTYGALREIALNENRYKEKFLFIRRTQKESYIVNNKQFCPFNNVNRKEGTNVTVKKIPSTDAGFFYDDDVNKPIGYSVPLSTFAGIRGADFGECTIALFDEFIPEEHVRTFKKEGKAFLNLYETVNRNRELEGEKPLKLICMSNSDKFESEILIEMGCLPIIQKMIRKNREIYVKGNVTIILLLNSPISEFKKETVLYKTTEGSEFYDMAVNNAFVYPERIESLNLKGFKPIFSIKKFTVYRKDNLFYVTYFRKGCPIEYENDELNYRLIRKRYIYLYEAYNKKEVIFENMSSVTFFKKVFGL